MILSSCSLKKKRKNSSLKIYEIVHVYFLIPQKLYISLSFSFYVYDFLRVKP